MSRLAAPGLVLLLVLTACADDGPERVPSDTEILIDTTALVADPAPDATVEDTTRDAAEENEVRPSGNATLTIGERTWRFGAIVCLVDEAAAAVDADFSLSADSGGFQLFVAARDEGDVITLVQSEGETRTVQLTTVDAGGPARFLRVDPPAVGGTAAFVPVDDLDAEPVQGTLDASCE